ncbi:MAG TPA: redoxin domain-containing protein [Pyrinomonadaceae bacterium]|nr:redoxin domain-containing protein [Pyrinomonadaceae bacterium]
MSIFAQTNNSTIVIKITKEKYLISGIVNSESTKRDVELRTRKILGENTDFSQLKVQIGVTSFQYLWQTEFETSLNKIKSWTSGIFVFSPNKDLENYPPIPTEIAESKIELADGKTVTIKDFKDKTLVLLFIEDWCGPCRFSVEALKDFYPQISSRNVEIIAVSSEIERKDDFQKVLKTMKFPFNFGWANIELLKSFVKISELNAIPQAFVIRNNKLAGVFMGGGDRVNERLKEKILEVTKLDSLSK